MSHTIQYSLSHDNADDVMMVVFNNYLYVGTGPGNSQYICDVIVKILDSNYPPMHAADMEYIYSDSGDRGILSIKVAPFLTKVWVKWVI